MESRLAQQLQFLDSLEWLKRVYRRNRITDRERFESSAEHSWHVALMAVVLAEHGNSHALDIFKCVKMLRIHDVVEILAGDTWLYDERASENQADREQRAAEKLFGLLPPDQGDEFSRLWLESESRTTAEARFAASIDMLQPLAHHVLSGDPEDEGPKTDARRGDPSEACHRSGLGAALVGCTNAYRKGRSERALSMLD